jgi:hypothetical protein
MCKRILSRLGLLLLLGGTTVLVLELPDIRHYLKIRSM